MGGEQLCLSDKSQSRMRDSEPWSADSISKGTPGAGKDTQIGVLTSEAGFPMERKKQETWFLNGKRWGDAKQDGGNALVSP